MATFSEVIKVLLEKRVVPTVLGLVSGALIYAFSNDNNWLLKRLGSLGFGLLWAGIIFLGATFIQWLINKIKVWGASYKEYVEDKRYEEREMKERLEDLWSFTDQLSPEKLDFIRELIRNDNQTIEKSIDYIPGYTMDYFHCSPILIMRQVERGELIAMQYQLEESFYKLVLYSLKTYKKINHFE